MPPEAIDIPSELRPSDGRFGSGPSKVRPEAVESLCEAATGYLGTSHRRDPVQKVVGRVRKGLAELFSLPDGYEVVLGNGGTKMFWDALIAGVIEFKSQHLVCGEFSAQFAAAVAHAPFLESPQIIESEPGTRPAPRAARDVDVYCLIHNETSTGVALPVRRVAAHGLVAVDATSGAGGMRVDPLEFDIYYFAPQKCFSSDGGLWIALYSPAAVERIERVAATDRYAPQSIDPLIALESSRKNQTFNTPALATLFLMATQIEWMLSSGGLEWCAQRCESSARRLYSWAERSEIASPFVPIEDERSPVVGTIDFDAAIDAAAIARILRANGVVDTEPYRKLGRNQLRVGMYPSVEPDDVGLLTQCIDYVAGELID